MAPSWKDEEIQILREFYPVGGSKAVQERLPHRPAAAINSKASKLQIRKPQYSAFGISILEALRKYPAGKSSTELAVMTDATESRTTKALSRLVARGVIGSLREGTVQASNRRRFYAVEHKAQAVAANREFIAARVRGNAKTPNKSKLALRLDPAQPACTKRAKVTICPSGKDCRFTPDSVEPFFSKTLGIGRYMA